MTCFLGHLRTHEAGSLRGGERVRRLGIFAGGIERAMVVEDWIGWGIDSLVKTVLRPRRFFAYIRDGFDGSSKRLPV